MKFGRRIVGQIPRRAGRLDHDKPTGLIAAQPSAQHRRSHLSAANKDNGAGAWSIRHCHATSARFVIASTRSISTAITYRFEIAALLRSSQWRACCEGQASPTGSIIAAAKASAAGLPPQITS
jgi:hypothetical protein